MRGGGRGRGEQGSRKRKQSEAAVVGAGSSQELLADLFRLDETEVGRAPVIVLDTDQVHGVVANGGDEGDASANTPPTLNTSAPGTPPEMAARFACMMEEGILFSTTMEQRRRNRPTSGTQYGVPHGLREALDHGYIHPNLPPPPGLEWRRTAYKTMQLVARGG